MRGEHELPPLHELTPCGSSPRAWGTLFLPVGLLRLARFIPTCVGNTRPPWATSCRPAVHPHVRGEHAKEAARCNHVVGSSPRAWGTPHRRGGHHDQQRFIPTCVGNTRFPSRTDPGCTVHPHVRGEHVPTVGVGHNCAGSSPRAWGTLVGRWRIALVGRFIPTCVGNTGTERPDDAGTAVHPHVRGEHSGGRMQPLHRYGSSPRAWGTQFSRCFAHSRFRFIPTCVGNTAGGSIAIRARAVHPHVRGEHADSLLMDEAVHGSSPRAWGTR